MRFRLCLRNSGQITEKSAAVMGGFVTSVANLTAKPFPLAPMRKAPAGQGSDLGQARENGVLQMDGIVDRAEIADPVYKTCL